MYYSFRFVLEQRLLSLCQNPLESLCTSIIVLYWLCLYNSIQSQGSATHQITFQGCNYSFNIIQDWFCTDLFILNEPLVMLRHVQTIASSSYMVNVLWAPCLWGINKSRTGRDCLDASKVDFSLAPWIVSLIEYETKSFHRNARISYRSLQ